MILRLVSDLHVDINEDGNFGFRTKWDEVDALLIAGDIAGSYERETRFLKGITSQTDKPIYAIAGNHLGYDYYRNPYAMFIDDKLIGTKQWSIDYIKKNTPENIHYMDDEYIDLGNYVLFAGTMYSDYKLYPNQYLSMKAGSEWLNDFRYVHVWDKKQKVVRRVTPADYTKYHALFMRKLRKCIKETKKDIIVMSHFAPSPKSISDKYHGGMDEYLNASYCSNMEKFIADNPRIKLWLHGHMHGAFDYYIEQCHIICEPYGYHGREQKQSPRKWYGKIIEI